MDTYTCAYVCAYKYIHIATLVDMNITNIIITEYRRIFHSIGPLFAENVKVDNLLPQHDLVTNSEATHLLHQTQSLAPLQINQLLLDCLAEKEIECLNLLLCSLNSEDEHLGHTDVAKELKQLMKTNDIEYEDICPVCNKAIN